MNKGGNKMKKYLSFILLSLLLITSIGAVWDIWSHNADQPETFWTPSHGMIYLSVAGAGLTTLGVVIYECMKIGSFSPKRIPNVKGLALAGSGSVFQLLAGVSDDIYHSIFGFDVTMWSPPHVAVLYGSILTLLGIFELKVEGSEIKSFFSSILAISMIFVVYQFSTFEYDMNFHASPVFPEDKNWDIIHRWKPYSAYLSILLIPVFSYCLTLATKKFHFAIGTITTSFAFLIKYLIFIWYNGTILDLYFPLWIPLCGVIFDLVYILLKKTDRSFYYANFAAGMILIFIVEIQNPLSMDIGKIGISFLGVSILSILFTRFALKGISLKGFHVSYVSVFLFILCFPSIAWAHDGQKIIPVEKIAPDLHPLWLLLEFSIIFFLGYRLARFLSRIDRKKETKD